MNINIYITMQDHVLIQNEQGQQKEQGIDMYSAALLHIFKYQLDELKNTFVLIHKLHGS